MSRKLKVLCAHEFSGIIREAMRARGHDAMSCDLLPSEQPGPHYQGDVFDVIDYPWDLGIFHPSCFDTSVSGARHFPAKILDGRQQFAVSHFMAVWRRSKHIKGVCLEHPVSIMSTLFRKPDQIVQPWMFGDYELKATCFWLRKLPPLKALYKTVDECREALGLAAGSKPKPRVHYESPSPNRWKNRSRTYPGIAAAMAEQWTYPPSMNRRYSEMRKSKFDKTLEKSILRQLDSLAKKHGLAEIRHSVNKWSLAQTAKLRLAKERRQLEAKLKAIEAKLRS